LSQSFGRVHHHTVTPAECLTPVQLRTLLVLLATRAEHGDFFGIGVSGYPEAHPDVIVDEPEAMDKNYWADIAYLKQKVG
jgi:hypothetical protein